MYISEDMIPKVKGLLQKIDFLQDLPPEEFGQIIHSLEKVTCKKGQTIMFQGEISHRLYLILSGKISVTVKKGALKNVVATLGHGEYFGEISLLEPVTAGATLKAEEESELYAITRDHFLAITGKFPETLDFIRLKIQTRKAMQEKNNPPPAQTQTNQ